MTDTGTVPGQFKVTGTEVVEPSPDILDALIRDYPLEASIADLVDNSIDAGATKILIRFGKNGGKLNNLFIADNGRGISESALKDAMQFGKRRAYGPKDLGMYGVGLKTASLSQAEILTVLSRVAGGRAAGRQWTREDIKRTHWKLNVLDRPAAGSVLDHKWGLIGPIGAGTVVCWHQVAEFERLQDDADKYIAAAVGRIRSHLGLKLHRFLEKRRIRIDLDTADGDTGETSPPVTITPVNPFPPANANGGKGYPKVFAAHISGAGRLRLNAQIWPKRSKDQGYKLGGKVQERQGFYFYRHDRLIQEGGWCGVKSTNEPHSSLARVEVDIPDALASYLKVRSNKAGVDVPPSFGEAVLEAVANDGTRFSEYLLTADEVYRHKGKPPPLSISPPGDGVPSDVRTSLERLPIRFRESQGISIGWAKMDSDDLFRIAHYDSRIEINQKYRRLLLQDANAGSADVPLLRTLLFWTLESVLGGLRIGPLERSRLNAILASTRAAIKLEKRRSEK